MAETVPLLSFDNYEDESELTLRRVFADEDRDKIEARLEKLDALDGYSTSLDGDVASVRVQTHALWPVGAETEGMDYVQVASQLISNLRGFGRLAVVDDRDGVVGIDVLSERGLQAVMYPRMQQWLNEKGLSDALKHEVMIAMSLPFGIQAVRQVYRELRTSVLATEYKTGIRVGAPARTFHVTAAKPDEQGRHASMNVSWRVPDLTTMGDFTADIGIDGSSGTKVLRHDNHERLYKLTTHNIDSPLQSVSLLLGLGTLARHAAEYTPEKPLL